MPKLKDIFDGVCMVVLLTILVNIVGYVWIVPSSLRCGPDGLQITGPSAHVSDTKVFELCRESLHQPRPIHVDQKSVVCWKKVSGEWQWEPCDRGELSKRQEKLHDEIMKQGR